MIRYLSRYKSTLALVFASLLSATSAVAQNKPFPQSGSYVAGFVPTILSAADALSSYLAWKANHLKADCGPGLLRVDNGVGDGTTFSEGMGYGMVLAAYFGDKAEFDGLWSFVKKNLNSNGVMGWHVSCSGFTPSDGGSGSATDGDTDVAFALVVAVDQWGDSYKQPALDFLQSMKARDYSLCSATGRVVATNGDWDTGCRSQNSSYFMPAYYRVFQRFTGDAFWGNAADAAIAIWKANANANTGLIANEVDERGNLGSSGQNYVDYNGCRVPWRAVLDYLWHGTPDAKLISDKITVWANSIGIANLVDGYATDGTPRGQYKQLNPWVGGFASGAMSLNQATANSFAADLRSLDVDNGGYYGSSLRSLYLLMLSGNQWEPGLAAGGAGGSRGGGTTSGGSAGMIAAGGSNVASGGTAAGGLGAAGGTAGAGANSSGASAQGGANQGTSAPGAGCGCKMSGARSGTTEVGLFALVGFLAAWRTSGRGRSKPRVGRRRSSGYRRRNARYRTRL